MHVPPFVVARGTAHARHLRLEGDQAAPDLLADPADTHEQHAAVRQARVDLAACFRMAARRRRAPPDRVPLRQVHAVGQQLGLGPQRVQARAQDLGRRDHVPHQGQQLALRAADRGAVQAGPGAEVVHAVINPVQVGERLGHARDDRHRGDDGGRGGPTRQQRPQRPAQQAGVERALEAAVEARPVDGRVHPRRLARRPALGRPGLGRPGPGSECPAQQRVRPALHRGQVEARAAHPDGVDPVHAIGGQQPVRQVLDARRVAAPIVAEHHETGPVVGGSRRLVHALGEWRKSLTHAHRKNLGVLRPIWSRADCTPTSQ